MQTSDRKLFTTLKTMEIGVEKIYFRIQYFVLIANEFKKYIRGIKSP